MNEPNTRPAVVKFQDRDFALLRGLFECRVMTASHIATLYFEGKREYTKKRLQKLKAAGFISERKRNANESSVLFLTRKAFVLLTSQGQLSEYPSLGKNSFEARANVSELTLRHELEIMDVKAAFHSAVVKSEKFSIDTFSTWPLLYQFTASPKGRSADVLVKPDGYIRICEKEDDSGFSIRYLFLEVDRSSETQDTLINRAVCYLNYFRTGDFAMRNGGSRSHTEEFPFRVLMIFKSAERRNNTALRLAQNNPRILGLAWLTTLAEVTADPLGLIWITPKDYCEATDGTPFDIGRQVSPFGYRSQPEREAFVEKHIKKFHLFKDA